MPPLQLGVKGSRQTSGLKIGIFTFPAGCGRWHLKGGTFTRVPGYPGEGESS